MTNKDGLRKLLTNDNEYPEKEQVYEKYFAFEPMGSEEFFESELVKEADNDDSDDPDEDDDQSHRNLPCTNDRCAFINPNVDNHESSGGQVLRLDWWARTAAILPPFTFAARKVLRMYSGTR